MRTFLIFDAIDMLSLFLTATFARKLDSDDSGDVDELNIKHMQYNKMLFLIFMTIIKPEHEHDAN